MTEFERKDIDSLTSFCVQNEELNRLGAMLSEFNVFEAAGLSRDELKHSKFLSFLLSPSETHHLGDAFLRRFLQLALKDSPNADLPITALNVELWDLTDTEVRTEWANIDVLVLNHSHKLAVIIENKVGTGEHSDQLNRYHTLIDSQFEGWKTVPIFLSPFGAAPSDERYNILNYDQIASLVDSFATLKACPQEVASSLRHYSQMIRRHIVTDSTVKDLCREIYRKHKKAIDLIFEYRQDHMGGMYDYLASLIDNDVTLARCEEKRNATSFLPVSWLSWMPISDDRTWVSKGWLLLFWFEIDDRGVRVVLCIGPGDRATAKVCLEAAQNNKPPFNPQRKEVSKKWNRIFTNTIVPTHVVSSGDISQTIAEFEAAWPRIRNTLIPQMERTISEAIRNTANKY